MTSTSLATGCTQCWWLHWRTVKLRNMYLFCISCKQIVVAIKVPTLVHSDFKFLWNFDTDERKYKTSHYQVSAMCRPRLIILLIPQQTISQTVHSFPSHYEQNWYFLLTSALCHWFGRGRLWGGVPIWIYQDFFPFRKKFIKYETLQNSHFPNPFHLPSLCLWRGR